MDIEIAKRILEVVDSGLVCGLGEPTPGQMCVEAAVCYAMGLPHGDNPQCVSPALRALKIRLNDACWSSGRARAKGLRRLAVSQLGSRDQLDDGKFTKRVAELVIRIYIPQALRGAASIHPNPTHQRAMRDSANLCEEAPTEKSSREARRVATTAAASTSSAAYAASASSASSAAAADAYAADANAAYAANAAAYASSAAANAASSAAAYDAYAAYPADAAVASAAAAYASSAVAYTAAANAAVAYAAYAAVAYAAYADAAVRDKLLADFAEDVVQILIQMDAPGVQWLALT